MSARHDLLGERDHLACRGRTYRATTTTSAVARVRDRPCTAANASMERNTRVACLPYVRTAGVRAVLINIIFAEA
jgi:hypothetical protein